MMRELETLLMAREKATNKTIKFGFKNNCVRCYAHIINIVSLHIISTFTSSDYESPSPDDYDSDDSDADDGNTADGRANANQVGDLAYKTEAIEWSAGLKRDPLNRARNVIRILRSLGDHRQEFEKFIIAGNKEGWFFKYVDGERTVATVEKLQPLRDVKTRWDSVYMMLNRLRAL